MKLFEKQSKNLLIASAALIFIKGISQFFIEIPWITDFIISTLLVFVFGMSFVKFTKTEFKPIKQDTPREPEQENMKGLKEVVDDVRYSAGSAFIGMANLVADSAKQLSEALQEIQKYSDEMSELAKSGDIENYMEKALKYDNKICGHIPLFFHQPVVFKNWPEFLPKITEALEGLKSNYLEELEVLKNAPKEE